MANLDRPRGFECYGQPLRVTPYVAGSACYPGDFVTAAADGQVDPATAGSLLLGLAMNYAAAAGDVLQVADHPDQVFVGQVAAAEYDNADDMFTTADILATAGNSTYKASRQEIDGASLSTSATAQLRVIGIIPRPNNAVGANVELKCRINEHSFTAAQDETPVGI